MTSGQRLPLPPGDDRRYLYTLGVDPGGTTGWGLLRLDWEALLEVGFDELALAGRRNPAAYAMACGELRGSENGMVESVLEICRALWRTGVWEDADPDVAVVVWESFILRMYSADPALLSPVRLLAKWDYAMTVLPSPFPFPQVRQSSSDAKRTVTDERLTRWGLWVPGPDHRRDALRHAALVARRMVEPQFRRTILQWSTGVGGA